LLLACDDDLLVTRVRAFYAEDEPVVAPLLLAPGRVSRFGVLKPACDEPVLERLRVTGFRDYLACPYRFYLKHVLKLGVLDDQAVEMDALAFGNLAHGVLERFGRSEVAHHDDPEAIGEMLSDALSQVAGARFGRRPRPAVQVQVEQLRQRLWGFAQAQAQLVQQGWRIRADLIEKDCKAVVEVDGQPFTLSGRVDRIDQHEDGRLRVLDYKTSDAGLEPEKTHRAGPKAQRHWVDLQLPLYRTLVSPLGVQADELGYINLPRSAADAGVRLAPWGVDELEEAMAVRDTVIRALRGRVFWPPAEPPGYADGLEGLCADAALDRAVLIAQAGGASNG